MIKLLKQYQIQVTPFGATKDWALNNTDNENLLLFESTGSDDGLPIALEFLDYGDGSGYPVENALCDIALEQQTNDLATSQTGLNVKGIVNTDTEPLNDDGTYKRSIYHQVKTMFYNSYLDPSKIWGVENIDFTLSQTQRNLSDQFRLVDIPRNVYGDKIVPKTVKVYDNTLDNVYIVIDDGNGNLFAGKNLFSHQQKLGEYINEFISNRSSSYCNDYWANHEQIHYDTDTANVSIGFIYGGLQNYVYPELASVTMTPGTGGLLVTAFPTSGSDLPNVTLGFGSGIITDTTQVSFAGDSASITINSSSVSLGLVTGSVITTTFPISGSDSSSVRMSFISGSVLLTAFPLTMSFNQVTNSIAFYRGFIA